MRLGPALLICTALGLVAGRCWKWRTTTSSAVDESWARREARGAGFAARFSMRAVGFAAADGFAGDCLGGVAARDGSAPGAADGRTVTAPNGTCCVTSPWIALPARRLPLAA